MRLTEDERRIWDGAEGALLAQVFTGHCHVDDDISLIEEGNEVALTRSLVSGCRLGGALVVAVLEQPARHRSALVQARCGRQVRDDPVLPSCVVDGAVETGTMLPLLTDWTLPPQEIYAVYPSPRLVPAKVSGFVAWLQGQFGAAWWAEER